MHKDTNRMNRLPYLMVLRTLFIIMPVVVLAAICFVQGIRIADFSVAVNDEVGWYNQIFSVVKYGRPLGHWGYNGTHAEIGTFGPWGASIVYFMSLFMKLMTPFVDIYSADGIYIVNNLLWACLANVIFVLLTKPNIKQTVKLIFVYAMLFVNHCYMFVAMSEIVRFSMGIILAGLMVYLLNTKDSSGFRIMLYLVAPIICIACISAYIMYGLVIPVWVYCVYKANPSLIKHKSVWLVLTFLITGTVTLTAHYINSLFTSPYFTSAVADLIAAFQGGIGSGLKYLVAYIAENLKGCDIPFILSTKKEFGGFFCFYLPFFYGLCIYILASSYFCWKTKNTRDFEYHFISAYLLIAFFALFLVLYSTYYWTLIRGINIPVIMVLYLLCMKEKDTDIKVIVPFMLLGVYPFMLVANNAFIDERVKGTGAVDYKAVFSEHIQISENKEPWENTIACYGDVHQQSINLPVGSAINHMISCEPNEKAEYVMVWKNALENVFATEAKIEAALDGMKLTHEIVYQDDELILLVNLANE